MARPIKNNADYFTHDSDMRNDPKVKAIRRKFRIEGYAIWSMLLEVLTDCDGFRYEASEINIEILAGDFDCSAEVLTGVIEYCIKLELLHKDDQGYVFSRTMLSRFETLLSKRKRDRNEVIVGDNSIKKELPRVIASDNPQSRVKESKGEESKENTKNNSPKNLGGLPAEKKQPEIITEYPGEYETFCSFVLQFANVAKMKTQLTEIEYRKLRANYTRAEIEEVIGAMENSKKLKNKTCVYLTALVYLKANNGTGGALAIYAAFAKEYSEFVVRVTNGEATARIDNYEKHALLSLIEYLKNISISKDYEGALRSWKHILANWNKLDNFMQGKIKAQNIDKEIIQIIKKIKDASIAGTSKNTSDTAKATSERKDFE